MSRRIVDLKTRLNREERKRMLKPKRKITKKEIKQDPLLETINELQHKYVEYKPWIIRIGAAVLVLIVVIIFMQNLSSAKHLESESVFGRALVAYEIGDEENAKFQFEVLAEEYNSLDYGKISHYYLGKIGFDNHDYEIAEQELNTFVNSNKGKLLQKNAHMMLSEIYGEKGETKKTEGHLKKAVKLSSNMTDRFSAELSLAGFYLKNEQTEQAISLIHAILASKDLPYNIKKQAEELSGKID